VHTITESKKETNWSLDRLAAEIMAAVGFQVLVIFLIGLWVGESAVAKPGILCPSYANVRCATPPKDLKTCSPKSPNCASNQRCCPNCWGSNSCYPPVITKPGYCPALDPNIQARCVWPPVNDCEDDTGCTGDQKCCQSYCTKICDDPVATKPGDCPARDPNLQARCLYPPPPNDCEDDAGCTGNQKCCQSYCKKICNDPVVPKRGYCPELDPNIQVSCVYPPRPNECEVDNGCSGDQKCCQSYCTKICDDPV